MLVNDVVSVNKNCGRILLEQAGHVLKRQLKSMIILPHDDLHPITIHRLIYDIEMQNVLYQNGVNVWKICITRYAKF